MVELLSYSGFIIMLQGAQGNSKEEVYDIYKAAYPIEQYPEIHRIVVKDIL